MQSYGETPHRKQPRCWPSVWEAECGCSCWTETSGKTCPTKKLTVHSELSLTFKPQTNHFIIRLERIREFSNKLYSLFIGCLQSLCTHFKQTMASKKKKKQFQHEKSCSSPWQGVYIHCWADMANLDLLQDWKGKFHKNKRTMFYFFFDNNDHSASKKFGPNLLLRFFAYFCHHLGFFMFASLFSQQPQRLQSEFQH